MSFKRYYAVDDGKREVVPAYWFMVPKKRRPSHANAGRAMKVKSALKRIEAEMAKNKATRRIA